MTLGRLLLFALVFVSAATAQQAEKGEITITVQGARNDKGDVWCGLYASESGFPKRPDSAKMRVVAPLQAGKGVCRFSGVAEGRYSVSIFHDENGNGKLDTNFIGIPKEGVAASNDATGHFGPPKFNDAAFAYNGGKLNMVVHLRYL